MVKRNRTGLTRFLGPLLGASLLGGDAAANADLYDYNAGRSSRR